MHTITRNVITEVTLYVASDGEEFKSETDCQFHEWKMTALRYWILFQRGQRSDDIEIYESRELAMGSIPLHSDKNKFVCRMVYVNERFWKVEYANATKTL